MEQDKALDKKLWQQVTKRIGNNLDHDDFLIMCKLHAKYKKHKYHEPNFCSCNAKRMNPWIKEGSEGLK